MNFNYTVLGLKADLRNFVRHKLLIKYKLNNDRIIIIIIIIIIQNLL